LFTRTAATSSEDLPAGQPTASPAFLAAHLNSDRYGAGVSRRALQPDLPGGMRERS